MGTFYVKTDVPEFTEKMKRRLSEYEYTESTKMPVDFLFISGQFGYYRTRFDTKRSEYISLLYGKSVETLTNKIELHKKYDDKPYLIPSTVLKKDDDIELPTRFLKILKPLGGFKGEGITIVQTKPQIKNWLEEHSQYTDWILQNYIRNPALKDGYKFHLRVLVAVVKEFRKPIRAYVSSKKFYVKAEQKYEKGDWLNSKIHDTHYKVGKTEVFPDEVPDDWSEKDSEKINKTIDSIIQDLLSSESDFKPEWNAVNGFEVFGVDIMFDKKHPYILEFNNKMGLKGRDSYASPIVDLILRNKVEPYFTHIL
jgi:hypothetical protein